MGSLLSVKARPQLLNEKHFVNKAVKFPVALLENTKLALISNTRSVKSISALVMQGQWKVGEFLGS